ncbi:MAG: sulfocyanin-like copper-binding protein [Actinomycetes bacterium]|jgi:uncharacterized cupredoxin-like copper-binding protein
MNYRRIRLAAFAAVAVLVPAAALSACGSSSSSSSSSASTASTATTTTAASGTVAVALTEFKIATTPNAAPAGTVTFNVTNSGKVKHQFTVIKTTKSAATVLNNQNPNDDIPGAKGEIASLAPGANKTLVIKNMVAGHYALVCALPGHFQSGMYENFTVN